MKMELTVSSETSAIRTQKPGNYPKRNKLRYDLSLLRPVTIVDKFRHICNIFDTVSFTIGKNVFFLIHLCLRRPIRLHVHV